MAWAFVIVMWLIVSIGFSLGLAYVLGSARRQPEQVLFEDELHSLAA